jgi:enoyl-CoA hydratase
MTEPILVRERRGAVLVLRLNRPEVRNALSPDLLGEFGLGLIAAEEDPEIRCVVLTGTGDRAFCAGMDLRNFAANGTPKPDERTGAGAYLRFMRGDIAVPVVGAANATAVAGGFELLLACDLVVVSADAKFGLPEVKRGLFAPYGDVFLGARLPQAVALELALTGDLIDADRALALGLVNLVVPAHEVLDGAVALADRVAANGPLAVAATRDVVRTAATADTAAGWARHAEWIPRVFDSADAREGASAYVEKRPPVWQGR